MRKAFTLLELLVVIAIIAIIMGLIIPAVQRVREAASCVKCINNLKQIGLACQNYEHVFGVYPDGGHAKKPGLFTQILPYLEQGNLEEIVQKSPVNHPNYFSTVPVPIYSCPSRPNPRFRTEWYGTFFLGDYAWARISLNQWEPKIYCGGAFSCDGSTAVSYSGWASQVWAAPPASSCPQVFRKPIDHTDITDGTSNTLLISEKQLGIPYYNSPNQDASFLSAGTYGNQADPRFKPVNDRNGSPWCEYFGSAHISKLNVLWCDKSVRSIKYEVAQPLWLAYATRAGNEVVID